MKKITINGKSTNAKQFAFDGCHKIYLIEDEEDLKSAKEFSYMIYNIEDLKEAWKATCDLRFINNWKLSQTYVAQFENAEIVVEEDD